MANYYKFKSVNMSKLRLVPSDSLGKYVRRISPIRRRFFWLRLDVWTAVIACIACIKLWPDPFGTYDAALVLCGCMLVSAVARFWSIDLELGLAWQSCEVQESTHLLVEPHPGHGRIEMTNLHALDSSSDPSACLGWMIGWFRFAGGSFVDEATAGIVAQNSSLCASIVNKLPATSCIRDGAVSIYEIRNCIGVSFQST